MKAVTFIGQMIIDNAALTRAANKIEILTLLQAVKFTLQQNLVEIAKNNIEKAYELINDSCYSVFIVVNGSPLLKKRFSSKIGLGLPSSSSSTGI